MKSSTRFCCALILALFVASPSVLWAAERVRTLSTGVGKEERIPHEGFTLLVVFAEAKGPLLADVTVKITGQDGATVLEAVSEGPWFYADLPAGTYQVQATRKDGTQHTASVTVAAGAQQVLRLTW